MTTPSDSSEEIPISIQIPAMASAPTPKIDRQTLIPLGVLASVLAGSILFYNYLETNFQEGKSERADIVHRIESLEKDSAQQWSDVDMTVWSSKLKILNPTINIPNPAR